MPPDEHQDQRRSLFQLLRQPHVVAYLGGVVLVAGAILGLDAALLIVLGAVIGVSAVALASRFRRRTRWLRFSLRGALIVITVACLALGWIVDEVRDGRLAVATIHELGGRIRYKRQPQTASAPSPMRWLRLVMGEEYTGIVNDVSFANCKLSDADLACVGRLTSLDRLDLDYTVVGDAGIQHLTGLQKLTWLDVEDTQITDRALASIGKLKALRYLILDGTNVTDDGLRSLQTLQSLRSLRLRNTLITDDGMQYLVRLKALKALDVTGSSVTPEGVARFRQARPYCNIKWDEPGPTP